MKKDTIIGTLLVATVGTLVLAVAYNWTSDSDTNDVKTTDQSAVNIREANASRDHDVPHLVHAEEGVGSLENAASNSQIQISPSSSMGKQFLNPLLIWECGTDDDAIPRSVRRQEDKEERNARGTNSVTSRFDLTDEQLAAIEKLTLLCEDWLFERDHQGRQYELELAENSRKVYSDMLFEVSMRQLSSGDYSDPEDVTILRDLFINADAQTSSGALMSLMVFDRETREAMVRTVGMTDPDYLNPGIIDLGLLYECRIYGDCSSDGITALQTCVIDPAYCNQSIYQHLNSNYSYNYVGDIISIVEALLAARNGDIDLFIPDEDG